MCEMQTLQRAEYTRVNWELVLSDVPGQYFFLDYM